MVCRFMFLPDSTCSEDIIDVNSTDVKNRNIILTECGLLPKTFIDIHICSTHFNILLKRNSDIQRRKTCQIPYLINSHEPHVVSSVISKKQKSSRLLTINDIQKIHREFGLVLPIGTPVCTSCLLKLNSQPVEEGENVVKLRNYQDVSKFSIHEESPHVQIEPSVVMEMETQVAKEMAVEEVDPNSSVTTDSQSELFQSQSSCSFESTRNLETLNEFLDTVNLPTFSFHERGDWNSYSRKSQNIYISRITEILMCVIRVLFPCDASKVFEDFNCQKTSHQSCSFSDHDHDFTDVVDSYNKAETWQQRRQVLSIIASKFSFRDVLALIPEVTPHRYYAAVNHSRKIGSALPVPNKIVHRQRLDPDRLDAFLDFITSSHVVRDLPYGEKKVKFSDGTVQNMPNVVRCMGSADIIQQFKAYCRENNIMPLGDSTMFRILSQCGAQVRKSLEGLDYFVAEGGRAFVTLQDVIDKLLGYQMISVEHHRDYHALLLQSKQYLRTDFKIHLSNESEVADHCMQYALNDTRDSAFMTECNHSHDMICESCEQMKDLLSSLENIFSTSSVVEGGDEINDLQFKVQKATQSIKNLKKHVVRCKNQDQSKAYLFEHMPSDEVLLICDWAMKFLPRKFREDQCDWFGKRGIPWHICMAFCRKEDGSIGSLGFIHLFANQISQDSSVTVSVISDVMEQIHRIRGAELKFHLWSDNAGCYKSTEMLAFLYHSGLVKTYNFCESQNGKGPCDRTAATIKSAIRRYVNQGHDVLTAQSMKEAIEQSMKTVRYRVSVVEDICMEYETKKNQVKPVTGISSYNNFAFSLEGIRVWKAYNVGPGKLIPSADIPIISGKQVHCAVSEANQEIDFHNLPQRFEKEENVFTCSNDGCTLSFPTFQDLSNHLMFGICEYSFECQFSNGCDITKKMYASKISKSFAANLQVSVDEHCAQGDNEALTMGWALKEERKMKRFNENQRSFLVEKFNVGLKTGRKEDPFFVAEAMLTARQSDGTRRFSYGEILSTQQITSFFSRMSRKSRNLLDDYECVEAQREETILSVRRELEEDFMN